MKMIFYKDKNNFYASKTEKFVVKEQVSTKNKNFISHKQFESTDILGLSENFVNKASPQNCKNSFQNSTYLNTNNHLITEKQKHLNSEVSGSENTYYLTQGLIDRKIDFSRYLEKIKFFVIQLSNSHAVLPFCQRLRPKAFPFNENCNDFIKSSGILEGYISIERLVKTISDTEKLKQFLFDKSQLYLFNFHYLNNYSMNPNDIELKFEENKFSSIYKNKVMDDHSKRVSNKLIQMYNDEMLATFN
jgi:hypothetical protein